MTRGCVPGVLQWGGRQAPAQACMVPWRPFFTPFNYLVRTAISPSNRVDLPSTSSSPRRTHVVVARVDVRPRRQQQPRHLQVAAEGGVGQGRPAVLQGGREGLRVRHA